MRVTTIVALLSVMVPVTSTLADVPGVINYQGTLTDPGGVALTDTVSMTFSIYTAPMGGVQVWTEVQPSVMVTEGVFNALLGSVNTIVDTVFADPERWLGIQVEGDPELRPRQRIASVAYALVSGTSGAGSDGDWVIIGDNIYSAVTGNVGIGTTTPAVKLHVVGEDTLSSAMVSPNQYASGDDSELILAEDDDGTYNMKLKYDGDLNQLQIYGQAVSTVYGPHVVVERNGGRVGIGTTNPDGKLHIAGTSDDEQLIITAYANQTAAPFVLQNSDGTPGIEIRPGGSGQYNTFIGDSVGYSNTTGYSNTFLGQMAGYFNSTGHENVFLGDGAGWANTTAYSNTFVGHLAGCLNTTGTGNTFFGRTAGYSNSVGEGNTFIGGYAGLNNDEGDFNTFLGMNTGRLNTTGHSNTFVGMDAGGGNITGYGNVCIGYHAGSGPDLFNKLYIDNTSSSSPLIYGEFDNDIVAINGDLGVGTMSPAAPLDVNGDVNTSSSYQIEGSTALSVTGGGENTLVGVDAGTNNGGLYVTFVGRRAGYHNADFSNGNTFIGYQAGYNNTTGDGNTFLGMQTGQSNTSGQNNTFIGEIAGFSNTLGGYNTFVGIAAGLSNTEGNYNTFLGYDAGRMNTMGSGNVFVGNHAGANETGSNKLYIANGSDTSDVLIYGDFSTGRVGIGTLNPYEELDVAGQLRIANALNNRSLDVYSTVYTASQMVNFETTQNVAYGSDMLQIKVGTASDDAFQFIECERGDDRKFQVNGNGDVLADGSFTGPADFCEMIAVSSGAHSVEPGDVMVIDPDQPQAAVRSSQLRSTLVAGIYSNRPGFIGSERDWDHSAGSQEAEHGTYTLEDMASEFDEVPLALVGIVPCKVSAENGEIHPGDLLVTSSTPGHAMRDEDPKAGTILGKALGSLSTGTGVIKVLVTLQ